MSKKFNFPRIDAMQMTDNRGNPITSANNITLIKGSGSTTIFTGPGVLLGIGIWKDIDGGTIWFTDADDAITGLPDATAKGVTDLIGTLPTGRIDFTNGLKVILADAAGIVLNVYTFEPD